MIYSEVAIDYKEGLSIYDPVTKQTFTDEEAREQPKEVRQRLIMKPNKIGCYVLTIEECDEILMKNESKQ